MLRGLLFAIALVMLVAGGVSALLGATSTIGVDGASAAIDSEFRFYAVWYVVTGVIVLRALRDLDGNAWVVRLIAAGFFFAGASRALSWIVVGTPHWSQIALMVIEFVLSVVLAELQAVIQGKRSERGEDPVEP